MSEVKQEKAVKPDSITKKDGGNDNMMAALATLPGVGLIMFYAMKDASPLVKSHAKQSNFHLVVQILAIGLSASVVLSCIGLPLFVLDFVLWVMQIIKAFNGEEYKMPVVGDFFDGLLK